MGENEPRGTIADPDGPARGERGHDHLSRFRTRHRCLPAAGPGVVDDGILVWVPLHKTLKAAGFAVAVADSGPEGMALIGDRQPDLGAA